MGEVYKVYRSDMVTVADAIRTKIDTTEQIIFPSGFVVAINGIETGKTGATLTVTTPDEGVTVTVTKGELSYTKTTVYDGTAVFSGLETGSWTVTITRGSQTVQKTVEINADYETSITFFSATINITYPTGSVCTVTDGVTTMTAPDTSGSWTCVVTNAGTWTIRTTTDNGCGGNQTTVDIVRENQVENVTIGYNVLSCIGSFSSVGDIDNSSITVSGHGTVIATTTGESPSKQGLVTYYSDTTFDLSKYKTLTFKMSASVHGSLHVGFYTSNTSSQSWDYIAAAKTWGLMVGNINMDTFSVDLSDASGQCYFGMLLSGYTNEAGGGTTTAEISDINLYD